MAMTFSSACLRPSVAPPAAGVVPAARNREPVSTRLGHDRGIVRAPGSRWVPAGAATARGPTRRACADPVLASGAEAVMAVVPMLWVVDMVATRRQIQDLPGH